MISKWSQETGNTVFLKTIKVVSTGGRKRKVIATAEVEGVEGTVNLKC